MPLMLARIMKRHDEHVDLVLGPQILGHRRRFLLVQRT
jgi:hypothetical protein